MPDLTMTEIPQNAHVTFVVPPMSETEIVTHLHRIIRDLRHAMETYRRSAEHAYERGYSDAMRDTEARDA